MVIWLIQSLLAWLSPPITSIWDWVRSEYLSSHSGLLTVIYLPGWINEIDQNGYADCFDFGFRVLSPPVGKRQFSIGTLPQSGKLKVAQTSLVARLSCRAKSNCLQMRMSFPRLHPCLFCMLLAYFVWIKAKSQKMYFSTSTNSPESTDASFTLSIWPCCWCVWQSLAQEMGIFTSVFDYFPTEPFKCNFHECFLNLIFRYHRDNCNWINVIWCVLTQFKQQHNS